MSDTTNIRIGDGRCLVAVVQGEKCLGVLIRDTHRNHKMGGRPRGAIAGGGLPGDIIIWLGSLESARELSDTLAHAILLMRGIVPIPKEVQP